MALFLIMFALASASLRQALQDMPELAEVSKHIMIEETKQGLNIEIVDQNDFTVIGNTGHRRVGCRRSVFRRLRDHQNR